MSCSVFHHTAVWYHCVSESFLRHPGPLSVSNTLKQSLIPFVAFAIWHTDQSPLQQRYKYMCIYVHKCMNAYNIYMHGFVIGSHCRCHYKNKWNIWRSLKAFPTSKWLIITLERSNLIQSYAIRGLCKIASIAYIVHERCLNMMASANLKNWGWKMEFMQRICLFVRLHIFVALRPAVNYCLFWRVTSEWEL